MNTLNCNEYCDKVLGCWMGKNIGGTLGAPFEGKREINDAEFYTQDLHGEPAPNDDLDLQLVWLSALERYGVRALNSDILAEFWLSHIIGPWNEYSFCHVNITNGLYPPLSGSCNIQFGWSNGAWIRSEIWACITPGAPDEAIRYAYMDSCADHNGEGIYAEMFIAALQSAAFVISNIHELIKIALSKIPDDCRIARAVKLVCSFYDSGKSWQETREALVADSNDLGWFQAPANVGFVVVGLLYGEGDFGRTVCRAVNCGDDTDCSGATAAATLGIIYGRSGIPEKWIKPIGNSIRTYALNPHELQDCPIPKTLEELTKRVVHMGLESAIINAGVIPAINHGTTSISGEFVAKLSDRETARRIWAKSPYELLFHTTFADIGVEYENGPCCKEGIAKKVFLKAKTFSPNFGSIFLKWDFPEGWSAEPEIVGTYALNSTESVMECVVIPGKFHDVFEYVSLEVTMTGRNNPVVIKVPFQLDGAFNSQKLVIRPCQFMNRYNRHLGRKSIDVRELT